MAEEMNLRLKKRREFRLEGDWGNSPIKKGVILVATEIRR
jgi:hypothetical protein